MNTHHQELLTLYTSDTSRYASKLGTSYVGSTKTRYPIATPTVRKLIKKWLKGVVLTPAAYKALLSSLAQGKSHTEYSTVGKLLEYCPTLRKTLDPHVLDTWLDYAEGWAEVDTLCQNTFSAEELLARWQVWYTIIKSYTTSKNIHKRRASLVLLTGCVRNSGDTRLAHLAFQNIDTLKGQKDILITKAISWLLRSLISYHRAEVKAYITHNTTTLPKIALRETMHKLNTGKK